MRGQSWYHERTDLTSRGKRFVATVYISTRKQRCRIVHGEKAADQDFRKQIRLPSLTFIMTLSLLIELICGELTPVPD